ncbi:MAG: class II glutamine amidotransferase [Oscillospiraceae bacterium]|nr:class II glutamine amidotransferase [Oscillospiraceae bacterium]
MCELLGFSARKPTDLRKQLRSFYAHSVRHPHGWGMMHSGGIVREAVRAEDSELLRTLLDTLPPQSKLLGHIRYATVGSVRLENCHPFTAQDDTGRAWTMIHNGTIYSGRQLIGSAHLQAGDTDSERLFLYLLRCINAAKPQTPAERFSLIESFVREIAPRNKLNLIIDDGDLLYVHKNMADTLQYRKLGTGYLFATAPVDDGDWHDLPLAQVFAYRDGARIFKGEPHSGIFVPTLQYITAADAMNI